jgi:hypothetical protein
MPEAEPPPVMVLSSNRPLELAELLASLARQDGATLDRRRVFLVQDGGHDPAGASPHWSDAVLLENLDIFRRLVPHGIPLPSYLHLGPVLTRDRAERLAFADLRTEAAVFVGDDVIPGRCYLRTLDQLLALALADPRICQVSADGDPRADPGDPSRLIALGRAVGRGLTRRGWLAQRPYLDAYLNLLRGRAYGQRDRAGIRALFQAWGVDPSDTTFEAALAHACVLTGTVRLGTQARFARTLAEADALGWDGGGGFGAPVVVEADACRAVPPTDAELAALRFASAAASSHFAGMPPG